MTIETENTTSILSAIAAAAKPAKAAKPVKAGRKAKTPTKKPVAAAKPAKPAKAPKETKMTETTTPAAPAFDLNSLLGEFHASDTRDDAFILALLQKAFDAGKAAPRARAPRAGGPTKRDLAADLLRRPEGCTTKDILEVTQWPAVSVPAIAKASGLTLRQEKVGRVTTYFGT